MADGTSSLLYPGFPAQFWLRKFDNIKWRYVRLLAKENAASNIKGTISTQRLDQQFPKFAKMADPHHWEHSSETLSHYAPDFPAVSEEYSLTYR